MLKEAMQFLVGLSRESITDVEDRPYSHLSLSPVLDPMPDALTIHTLTGISDYLAENTDGLNLDNLLVHVGDAKFVALYQRLSGPFEQRPCFIKAAHTEQEFAFGRFMDIEQFVIELQAKFVQDDLTAKILQVVGNITDGVVNTFADDGITQQVTSKTGIGRVVLADIPNPVTLQPYRTFSEIDQPPGKFILRMQAGGGQDRPKAALFEADGGAWKLEAIKRIQKWLRDHVQEEVAVIA
jgi:hypothetical protein